MKNSRNDAGWWGGRDRSAGRLTLLELVKNNTLDIEMAALLWLLVEKKSSIIVAAGPQLAGKTTLLTALTDLIPPWYEKVYTRGWDEDFSFLSETESANTYILVPEFSNHTPAYLWGDELKTLFQALERGYSVAATMHADSPEEVVGMLGGHPLNIPAEQIANLHAIVNLALVYGEQGLMRRVSQITLIGPGARFTLLARWDSESDIFSHIQSPDVLAAVATRLDMSQEELEADLARRGERLESRTEQDFADAGELERLVAQHYQQQAE